MTETAPALPHPCMPELSVIAIAWHGECVALVLRANPPQAGHWGFPGGRVHLGEGLVDAAIRELAEETDLKLKVQADTSPTSEPVAVLEVTEGAADQPDHHFVLVAIRLTLSGSVGLKVADDARDTIWADPDNLPQPLCRDVEALVTVTRPA